MSLRVVRLNNCMGTYFILSSKSNDDMMESLRKRLPWIQEYEISTITDIDEIEEIINSDRYYIRVI